MDRRIERMAETLVNYSLNLKKNDLFVIFGNELTMPLIKAVYKKALEVGAHPQTLMSPADTEETFYKTASKDQLKHISPFTKLTYEEADAVLTIWGPKNTRALSNIDPLKRAIRADAGRDLSKVFTDRMAAGKVRWCGTQYPTDAAAQEAEMSIDEYEDFVYEACYCDGDEAVDRWTEVSKKQEKIAEFMNKKEVIRLVARDTDITLHVKGRKWINCDGKENFPDGEVFTSPIEDSVDGHIRYSYPAIREGREVQDIRLTFKKGEVTEAKAVKGEEYLKVMLKIDDGAKRLGELAFGLNYGIDKFTKNILFDEKIGGTMHLALGNGFPEAGSKNVSGIHWDMLCDMHKGKVYADDEVIYENGRFISL